MTNPGDGAAGAADRATLDHWRPRLAAIAAAAGQDDAAHDLGHLRRVWDAARAMLQAHPEADALVVLAASYLHDLVNLPKNHPERHLASRQAAAAARERLARAGFPAARLDAVAHAIEAHSFSAGIAPRTIEARIVQDADRLDALGPVGLWCACSMWAAAWAARWPIRPIRWPRSARSTTAAIPWTISRPSWPACRTACRPRPAAAWASSAWRGCATSAPPSRRSGAAASFDKILLPCRYPRARACPRRYSL